VNLRKDHYRNKPEQAVLLVLSRDIVHACRLYFSNRAHIVDLEFFLIVRID